MGRVEKENWFPRTFTSIRLIREGNDLEEEVDILCLLELLTLTMANVNLDKYFSVS